MPRDVCLVCGKEIKTMCWKGTGGCGERHQPGRVQSSNGHSKLDNVPKVKWPYDRTLP